MLSLVKYLFEINDERRRIEMLSLVKYLFEINRTGREWTKAEIKTDKERAKRYDETENERKEYAEKEEKSMLEKINKHSDFEDLRKQMRSASEEQARHWPIKDSGNDKFEEFTIHSITPSKNHITIHGDGRMKDGHDSTVYATYYPKTKKFSIDKGGING